MPLDRRPVILSPELSDAATIVNTPAQLNSSFPYTNVFTDHPADVWKPGVTIGTLDFDFGSNQLLDSLYIGYVYASQSVTSGFQLYSYSDAFITQTYTSGSVSFDNYTDLDLTSDTRRSVFYFTFNGFGGVARRYWRLQIASLSPPPATKDWYIGRIILGSSFIPTRNMDFGWTWKWFQEVERDRSYSGSLYITHKSRYRIAEMEFSYGTETEAFDDFYILDRKRGLDKPVVVCIDPEKSTQLTRRLFYGPLQELTPIENQYLDYYKKRLIIHEMEGL